ncbi:MAG: hypothetical protein HYS62_00560 [Candidatus Aenigmarchaeota archaeon]|nr:hypothetical protein [Candidatus Aenigmarchaeota archaeon]
MAKTQSPELARLFGKRLMVGGFVLLLTGVLWKYGVDWPTILIIIGAILFMKGIYIKTKGKLI